MYKWIIAISCFLLTSVLFASENIFYVLHESNDSPGLPLLLNNINHNADAINIIISQAYQLNRHGELKGYLNTRLLNLAEQRSLKVMAMITNQDFDQWTLHQFLTSRQAQDHALNTILAICQKYHLYGIQFDFEMIALKDKPLLTAFYQRAATILHQYHLKISFAVVPLFTNIQDSAFLKKTYQNWSGGYDLQALGRFADFITIMAYNQHPDGTTPGPNASLNWIETALRNTLRDVPGDKISLGLPAYSLYWFTGTSASSNHIKTQRLEISYKQAMQIINKNHGNVAWNNHAKVNYAVYEKNWLNEYVYLEDSASLKARMALVDKYHLRGVSIFRIGTEDKNIWAVLNRGSYLG